MYLLVCPIENGDIPASYVSLSDGTFPKTTVSNPWRIHGTNGMFTYHEGLIVMVFMYR